MYLPNWRGSHGHSLIPRLDLFYVVNHLPYWVSLSVTLATQKGIGLTFLNWDVDRPQAISSNASKLKDIGENPGKSSLFWKPQSFHFFSNLEVAELWVGSSLLSQSSTQPFVACTNCRWLHSGCGSGRERLVRSSMWMNVHKRGWLKWFHHCVSHFSYLLNFKGFLCFSI